MSEENAKKGRRRFDPAMMNDVPEVSPMMGVVGQMLGGLGAGLGHGFVNKMSERTMIAAAALQGLIGTPGDYDSMRDMVKDAVKYADMLLAELERVPDPRFPEPAEPSVTEP